MNNGIKQIEKLKHLGKADLHMHSNHSDGRPTVEEILEYVENQTDLDVIAITDHDTMDGAFEAVELMRKKKYRFELILGEEVSSKEGHVLSLFLTEKIKAGMSAHATIKEVRAQGGIAIAAHPFEHLRYRLPNGLTMDGVGLMTLLAEKKGWHGIEIVNATPTLGAENLRAAFINRTILLKAETGSSDAHIVEAIGKGYTLFEGKTAVELRHAIAHHQTQAMNARWNFYALFRYAFFFIPVGLRLFFFTLIHGKSPKKVDLVNVPKEFVEENKSQFEE
ncbi:MAG: PHP domain-containing protein [bacterium]|nr:PHP domain-containing protein [bacterium]